MWARFCNHESQAANPFVHATVCALHTWAAPVGAAPGWREKRSAVEIGNPVAADCAILPSASLVAPWP